MNTLIGIPSLATVATQDAVEKTAAVKMPKAGSRTTAASRSAARTAGKQDSLPLEGSLTAEAAQARAGDLENVASVLRYSPEQIKERNRRVLYADIGVLCVSVGLRVC